MWIIFDFVCSVGLLMSAVWPPSDMGYWVVILASWLSGVLFWHDLTELRDWTLDRAA